MKRPPRRKRLKRRNTPKRVQPTSLLALADAVVAAPAAGLVEMEVPMRLGVVLIYLACVRARLPWVLGKVTASVEKVLGPSAVYGNLFEAYK